ncbi:MAG: penicillin-binding protein 1B [Pseudomonadota bacterium]|nr:penicillin-binding protein 1B [Pseudomonadota bacterium]
MKRLLPILALIYSWCRIPLWLVVGVGLGFGLPYAWYLNKLVRAGFESLSYELPSRVFARPLRLARGVPMSAEALRIELDAARYRKVDSIFEAGTYSVDVNDFQIRTRAFNDGEGEHPEVRLSVRLASGSVSAIEDLASGQKVELASVDPARIATLYGKSRQERRLVKVDEVSPLLVNTLLAVEDKHFYSHYGIDPWGIARALWVNLRAGETVQGGSTLTQQLVRNLFLDRRQRYTRKFNEMGLALLIEWRYSKKRILEAYLNEVYLGQQGGQAVHGVAAAAEFYFGREHNALAPNEVAMLVGLVQGPSLFDPRREPALAIKRRNLVLREMGQAKLISAVEVAAEQRQQLAISKTGALAQNRYPAFLDLVRAQLGRDYAESALRSEGLSIFTSIAPSTQHFAERSVVEKIKTLAKDTTGLQAAMVVSHARTGAIEAVVGDRDANRPGFNRAVTASRPIGSLVKPFIYLVALAQPERYSLMTPLDDSAITIRQKGGKVWQPRNSDNQEHGTVALIDALAKSYNLATVRLGLAVQVQKVERVLETLIPGADISPHPSLLLGATELSPLQVTQAYAYLAADGRMVGLSAVTAVLDRNGRPLSRYASSDNAGELVAAARLVSFALQETGRTGTASELGGLGLGRLQAAGKTGTSDDKRDSWFAGYTGSHLAVVWLGRDDNTRTTFYGATGAMRLWAGLFQNLPTEPLRINYSGNPEMHWVNPQSQSETDRECEGARSLPFVSGHAPREYQGCGFSSFNDWFNSRTTDDDDEAESY